jgi:predicted dehydrogenase
MSNAKTSKKTRPASPLSRRDFLKTTAAATTTAWLTGCATLGKRPAPIVYDKTLRVGVIGCGGRGTGAAMDCLAADDNVQIVALADLFQDRLDGCRKALAEREERPQDIPDGHCFVGFDAYQRLLETDVDLVIHATPPGFRPLHLRAAVNARKHIFTEKPVGVDPVGIRSVVRTAELAKMRNLAIVAGTQRRHDPAYRETMRRIHRGDIGEIVSAQAYWNQGALWVKEHKPEWSDMEWQCRNWLYFTWISGDHIVEQHIHNLDVINWAMGSPPVKALGTGGRQVRTEPKYGNIFDHFAVEYTYPNGARVMSMCRQQAGTSDRVAERLIGTRGEADPSGKIEGRRSFEYEPPNGEWVNPYVQEHVDLIHSIRTNRPLNEGRRVAESTLTVIMGRMSAYTGREVSWDWIMKSSELDLTPPAYTFGDLPVGPVPVPGVTELV